MTRKVVAEVPKENKGNKTRCHATKKRTKIFKEADVLRVAWMVKTFDEDRYIKVSMTGLFVKVGNFNIFKTIEELYPEVRNIVDSKGLVVAKRKNRDSGLLYCKDKQIKIPA